MNPIELVAAYRPSDESLEELWSPAQQAAAFDRVVARTAEASTALSRHRGRRVLVVGISTAVAASAAVVIPILLPSGGPGGPRAAAAAELTRLAHVAATTAGPTAAPGQFLHLLIEERMGVNSNATTAPSDAVVLESWTAYDGTIWRRDHNNPTPVDYYKFPPGGNDTAAPSPTYLNSLPTDPAKLERQLRHNPDEPDGSDHAVFTAVGDILRGGYAPPALRTALVTVLTRLNQVELGAATSDALGRPAVQFTIPGSGSLYFDPSTATVIEETDASTHFMSLVKTADVVDAVPDDVLRQTDPQR